MVNNDGYASKEAKELGDIMHQCERLRSLAISGVGVLGKHYIEALNEAAITIEKLALKPIDAGKE